jgi:hypothetical protein
MTFEITLMFPAPPLVFAAFVALLFAFSVYWAWRLVKGILV